MLDGKTSLPGRHQTCAEQPEAEFADITGKDVPYHKSSLIALLQILGGNNVSAQHAASRQSEERWHSHCRPASTSTESYTAGVCDAIPKLASHRQRPVKRSIPMTMFLG